jgi:hypothetical protein
MVFAITEDRSTRNKSSPAAVKREMDPTPRRGAARLKLAVAALLVLAPLGCSLTGKTGDERSSETGSAEQTALGPQAGRASAVYGSVIRELVTAERIFARARVIYVMDGAIENAADPRRYRQEPKRSFSEALKEEIATALSDVAPVRFVAEPESTVDRDGEVRNEGILISLGPIRPHRKRVEVGCNAWMKGKDNRWLTYVVR